MIDKIFAKNLIETIKNLQNPFTKKKQKTEKCNITVKIYSKKKNTVFQKNIASNIKFVS